MSDYKIQAILFEKSVRSIGEAVEWILEHGYAIKKIDELPDSYKFKQLNEAYLKSKGYINYQNKEIAEGVILVLVYKELRQVNNLLVH